MNDFIKKFDNRNDNNYENTETGKTLSFGAKIFGTFGTIFIIGYNGFKITKELIKIFKN